MIIRRISASLCLGDEFLSDENDLTFVSIAGPPACGEPTMING